MVRGGFIKNEPTIGLHLRDSMETVITIIKLILQMADVPLLIILAQINKIRGSVQTRGCHLGIDRANC